MRLSTFICKMNISGLFHRGFSESGNVFNPWAIQGYALEKAKRIANAVGCPSDTSIEIITCLKTKSAEEIIKTKIIFSPFTGVPLVPAAPVVEIENDGAFLTSHPYKMLIEKKATDLPWVQSIAEHEGSFFALCKYCCDKC